MIKILIHIFQVMSFGDDRIIKSKIKLILNTAQVTTPN